MKNDRDRGDLPCRAVPHTGTIVTLVAGSGKGRVVLKASSMI
jgi:hypothetical protein